MISRARAITASSAFSAASVAAAVYLMELALRAFGTVDASIRWEIPVGAAALIAAGWWLGGGRVPRRTRHDSMIVGPAMSLVVAVGGILSGSGIGRLQAEVIAAGLVVPALLRVASLPWTQTTLVQISARLTLPHSLRRARWIGPAVLVLGAAGAWAVLLGTPLGHDEAVYALKARSWIEGTPDTGFGVFRPIGMPAVGWVLLQLSHAETVLRLFGLAGIVMLVAGVWWFGYRLFGMGAGLVAGGVLIGAPSLLRRTPEFLNDIFTAALMLGVAYLLWRHLEERPGDRAVLWVGPVALAAFYLRYGSLTALGAIALAAVLVWPGRVWQERRLLMVVSGVFIAGLIPHAVYSAAETGSITGVMDAARRVAGRDYLGEGLVDYVAWSRDKLAGHLAAVVGALGLAETVRLAWMRRGGRRSRAMRFLVVAALSQMVVLGLAIHAEERYVFLAIAFLLVAGSGTAVQLLSMMRAVLRAPAAVALALVMAVTFVHSIRSVDRQLSGVALSRAILVKVSDAIAPTGDDPCVALTSSVPEVTWYSGCATYRHDNGFGREEVQRATDGYVILFDNAKDDALRTQVEDLIGLAGDPRFLPSGGGTVGDALVWSLP